jgi:hypothetical protein
MIDKSWEGFRQFYELAFGTWIAYLFLLLIWKRLFKADHKGWKYALITLIGGSNYIINHYFYHAPLYHPLTLSYTLVFLIVYFYLLVKPLKFSPLKKTLAFLSSIVFVLVYIMAEEVARFLVQGRLIPGVHVPEFIFVVIAYLAFIVIILVQRK